MGINYINKTAKLETWHWKSMKIARLITYISSIKREIEGAILFLLICKTMLFFANSSIGWNFSNVMLAHAERCDIIEGGKQLLGRANFNIKSSLLFQIIGTLDHKLFVRTLSRICLQ